MKKNLIGAVAAGLALAFAFTACESGNDNPIRIPTDADAAVYEKKTFDYKAAPTEYTAFAEQKTTSAAGITTTDIRKDDVVSFTSVDSYENGTTALATGNVVTNKNYSWSKYVDGINSYNKLTGVWSGAATKGTAIGDVVNTKYETISLNTVEKTGKWSKTSSKYEVRGLRTLTAVEYGAGTTGQTPYTYFYKVLTGTSAYDTLPYYVLPEADRKKYTTGSTTYPYALTEFVFNSLAGPSGDWPYLTAGRATSHDAAQAQIELAITYAKDVLKQAEQNTTSSPSSTGTAVSGYDSDVKAAKAVVAKLENLKNQSVYCSKGATVSILDTTTVDEKTTGSIKYYTAVGGTLIATEDKAATSTSDDAMIKTFKYTLTDNYLNGKIFITEYAQGKNKWVFTDDKDYYYKNDVRGVISVDFPVATDWVAGASTTMKAGSAWQKLGRTLNINNGVLTGTGVDVNYKNHNGRDASRVIGAAPWGRTGYFISSSYNSFDLYYKLNQSWTANNEPVDAYVSYSYKLQ